MTVLPVTTRERYAIPFRIEIGPTGSEHEGRVPQGGFIRGRRWRKATTPTARRARYGNIGALGAKSGDRIFTFLDSSYERKEGRMKSAPPQSSRGDATFRRARPGLLCDGPNGPGIELDHEYMSEVGPLLTKSESQVYLWLIVECVGSGRPITNRALAHHAQWYTETVRKVLRRLERLGLIRSEWLTSPRSPFAQRRVEVLRDYRQARAMLQAERQDGGVQTAEGAPC